MTKDMKAFFDQAEKIKNQVKDSPLEYQKPRFMNVANLYVGPAGSVTIDLVLYTALLLGGIEGAGWFREAIPLNDRIKAFETSREMNLPEDTSKNLRKLYLGDIEK